MMMMMVGLRCSFATAATTAWRRRLRGHQRCCFFGQYSRMLDLGGAPSSMHLKDKPKLNVNKNCHLQAVVFDFDVLTTSIDTEKSKSKSSKQGVKGSSSITAAASSVLKTNKEALLKPDTSKIQQVANLLNVDLTNTSSTKATTNTKGLEAGEAAEDLSLLIGSISGDGDGRITKSDSSQQQQETNLSGDSRSTPPTPPPPESTPSASSSALSSSMTDIRTKYAAKLKQKGVSVADMQHAHQEKQDEATSSPSNKDTIRSQGDAASHFAARKHAAASIGSSSSSSSRWMAGTGTGQLLQYLYQRSMKLALVGIAPSSGADSNKKDENDDDEQLQRQMDDFTKQVSEKVQFDVVLNANNNKKNNKEYDTMDKVVATVVRKLLHSNDTTTSTTATTTSTIAPDRCLWVSHRDSVLKAAKEAGLVTVRIRRPHGRRGNVSAHYDIASVPETQTVVNEINGISFNTVLRQQQY